MVGALALRRSRLGRGTFGRVVNSVVILAILFVVGLVLIRVVQHGPAFFLQILTYGLADGAIYALIALGYTMVYGIIELINFAHGDVFTLGAFIALALIPSFGLVEGKSAGIGIILPLVLIFLITMLITGGINVAIERVAYRPLRNAPRLAPLITAVGMSFTIEGVIYLWKGAFNVHFPDILPSNRFPIGGGSSIGVKDIIVIVVAAVLVVGLSFFISGTKLGKAMRATAQDRDAALLMGIDINRTIAATFFIGGVLAAAGGIIFGLYIGNLTFDLGFAVGLFAFTAAVLGGIGNIQGAALGGLMIGIIAAFWDGYMSSTWTQVVIFAILVLTLLLRPTGLLGMRVPEK